ncbi:phage tail assembly chaperone [Tropicimonas isoalkanivorans]|uniref:Uncharacterized protein n=1 Tax=Tropicimonas isoalkanivorans TaxID=441112 RepID=A0A1I1EB78_9RHOB|nr:hypothetical protein [Tropicimonas isoalkanivorans]SFB82173.1 hypothetical protein SAMN04488094_101640 [Tropicimonas isoalkanivorans]
MTPAGQRRLTRLMVKAVRDSVRAGKAPNLPEAGRVLWGAFMALHRTRSYGGLGPNPITYQEIEAWCRLARMPLEPHHVEILTEMDREWLGGGKADPAPRSGITPALFDAVFG